MDIRWICRGQQDSQLCDCRPAPATTLCHICSARVCRSHTQPLHIHACSQRSPYPRLQCETSSSSFRRQYCCSSHTHATSHMLTHSLHTRSHIRLHTPPPHTTKHACKCDHRRWHKPGPAGAAGSSRQVSKQPASRHGSSTGRRAGGCGWALSVLAFVVGVVSFWVHLACLQDKAPVLLVLLQPLVVAVAASVADTAASTTLAASLAPVPHCCLLVLHLSRIAPLPLLLDRSLKQLTAEILKRYIELESKFVIGWLMQFPGGCVKGGGGSQVEKQTMVSSSFMINHVC